MGTLPAIFLKEIRRTPFPPRTRPIGHCVFSVLRFRVCNFVIQTHRLPDTLYGSTIPIIIIIIRHFRCVYYRNRTKRCGSNLLRYIYFCALALFAALHHSVFFFLFFCHIRRASPTGSLTTGDISRPRWLSAARFSCSAHPPPLHALRSLDELLAYYPYNITLFSTKIQEDHGNFNDYYTSIQKKKFHILEVQNIVFVVLFVLVGSNL